MKSWKFWGKWENIKYKLETSPNLFKHSTITSINGLSSSSQQQENHLYRNTQKKLKLTSILHLILQNLSSLLLSLSKWEELVGDHLQSNPRFIGWRNLEEDSLKCIMIFNSSRKALKLNHVCWNQLWKKNDLEPEQYIYIFNQLPPLSSCFLLPSFF